MSEPGPARWPRAPLLLCASSSRTGPVEGLIALAAWLRSRHIDARFAGDTVRPGEDLPGHLARAGVPLLESLRLSRKVRPGDLLHDARNLSGWVREGTPDLLHTSFAHDQLLALWAARRAGPIRASLRVVREAQRAVDLAPGRLGLRRTLLKACDGVLVRARSYRTQLLDAGFEPERVAAIPGSVDCGRFSPGRTDAAARLRRGWGVPEGAPLVGLVARMKPERLQEQLVRAMPLVRAQVPGAWLVLVGRGEDEARLGQLAAENGPQIVLGGYQRGDALIEAYRALDVAVWLREGNDGACRGVLEAMASGLPLVVGDLGAPPELIDGPTPGGPLPACGSAVDPAQPEAIARALVPLLADPALRASLGALARARAEQFTLDRSAEATLAFWRSLYALPPRERPARR